MSMHQARLEYRLASAPLPSYPHHMQTPGTEVDMVPSVVHHEYLVLQIYSTSRCLCIWVNRV